MNTAQAKRPIETVASAALPPPAERVARIAPLLTAAGPKNEALGQLIPEVVDALHEQALYRMLLPKAYGGQEVSPPEFFQAMLAIAACDASTAWCIGQQNGCAMAAAYMEPSTARHIWANDPRAALAWGPPFHSQAVPAEGGHTLSGKWGFGSGCRHANWIGLQCTIEGGTTGVTRSTTGQSSRTFIVPATQVAFEPSWDVIGLRATSSDSWTVKDQFVASTFAVRRDTASERRIQTPLYLFPSMMLFAIGFSAVAIGTSRSMVNSFLALAKGKTQRGVSIPLRDNHAVHMQVGEAEGRVRSAIALVSTTVERVWSEVLLTGELTNHQRLDIRLATTHAQHEAKTAADIVWDAAGSTAIDRANDFERRFRDLHTVTQQVQGRRMNLQVVGSYLLGNEPDMSWA